MKNFRFALIFLLLIPLASASTPNYSLVNNINAHVIVGNNSVGNLVFVQSAYTPEYHNLNSITTISVQQYDRLIWNGNFSATITDQNNVQTLLTAGSDYLFSNSGNYVIASLSDPTITANILSIQATLNQINLVKTTVPNGFDIIFSENNFLLQNERVIPVRVEVDDDIIAGNYNFVYKVNNNTRTQIFSVAENHNWTVINKTVNSTINAKVGENVNLGFYNIRNNGNVDVEIITKKIGDNSFLVSVPQPFTLYKKTDNKVGLQLQIPSTQKPGMYNISINITSSKKSVIYPLNIIITDAIEPIIESINFSTDRAYKNNSIVVIAKDNNAVSNVTLTYDGKVVVFDKDEQLFKKSIVFDKLSRYVLKFCAVDYDNNKKCIDVNKTFVKSNIIVDFDNSIVMPSKKVGKYSTTKLFNLTENVPEGINIELIDFVPLGSSVQNSSYTVRIVDGDGSIKTINQYDTDAKIFMKGIISVEVRSENVADYNGLLRITSPSYINEVTDLNFKVSFKNYDIPEPFTNSWIGGRDLVCNVEDTGDLSTSYYNCKLTFPIDTRPEEISVPTTVKERDAFKNEALLVEEELSNKKGQFAIFVSILTVLLLLSIALFYYMTYQYPYIRIRRGIKTKDGDK